MKSVSKTFSVLNSIRPYLTVASFYVLTDWILDLGLVTIPAPWDFVLYTLRYGAVVGYSAFKFARARRQKVLAHAGALYVRKCAD